MDGITIVEQLMYRGIEIGGLIAILFIITSLSILYLVIGIIIYRRTDKSTKITIRYCSIITIIINVIIWYCLIDSYNNIHVEYKVIIDDSVGFNEFYEKYEIISINGNIYTIAEK